MMFSVTSVIQFFIYLDDILIFSLDLETHRTHVRHVLQHHLYVKCEFHSSTVSFLRFIISEGTVSMDFLVLQIFYRKFIKNFSAIASPSHTLTSSKKHIVWTKQAEEVFQLQKERFATAPVLTLPGPKFQLIVEVDACDVGTGAVLSQRSLRDCRLHPCAFLSKKLSLAERNYNIGNRTPGSEGSFGRVETLVGGGWTTMSGLNRSQKP